MSLPMNSAIVFIVKPLVLFGERCALCVEPVNITVAVEWFSGKRDRSALGPWAVLLEEIRLALMPGGCKILRTIHVCWGY